jgi:uncharacterized iron-regulated membrane protein
VVAARAGLARPYPVVLPDGAESSRMRSTPTQEQTLHVDRDGGQVASANGYEQHTTLAKTVSHGIALHEGRHLGVVNMVASALICLGILFLCVTGPLM